MYKILTALTILCLVSVAQVGAQEILAPASPNGGISIQSLEAVSGAKVTYLEPSYMDGLVAFQLDKGTVSCPAGQWLYWNGAETKAVYATLLAALINGNDVSFYNNAGDTSCYGAHLHIVPLQ